MTKKNFKIGTYVEFYNCEELTGHRGVVIGKCFSDIFDVYIILLDQPLNTDYGDKALTITEHCLMEVPEND